VCAPKYVDQMRRWRRASILLALAVALGASPPALAGETAGSVATASHGPSGEKARPPTNRHEHPPEVTLAPTLTPTPGGTVTMPPVGLSLEYPAMAHLLGASGCPSSALASELLRLGSPPLELGGVSQDMTAPSGGLSSAPTSWETATLYSPPPTFWGQLRCLLSAAKDPLTVGLNMKTGNLSWATEMVAGAQSAASAGLSFSLGNEPDLYGLPNYASLAKPLAGEEAASANLYLQLATYLRPAVGTAPIIGPELARPADWHNQLPRIINQLHEQTVGVHAYPLTNCSSPRAVTIGGLLTSEAADAPARLQWVVADARAAGLPAIISEANSASCGGLAGVSDSPAAAVWAVRFVLSALKTGFREVRFHFAGDPYDPFIANGAQVLARPIESALVALNRWMPVGSSLRTVAGVRGLVATAVGGPGGRITLILDNEHARARPVVLHSAGTTHIAVLTPTRVGLQPAAVNATRTRFRLSVAANSVLVISTP
jgi:hypothetical protein